jgi:hypothetical protein
LHHHDDGIAGMILVHPHQIPVSVVTVLVESMRPSVLGNHDAIYLNVQR